ncbi:ankyrin repeat domain-containing protein [Shewanella sp. MEBiC00475]|uniref:ankyrin repeat domain-containing protein n=1 Tax=Shewanella sp. MEBiC00475 TaxID=2575361 RepID=UPI0010C00BAA|nr:hypothetical protein [Shewanella sp. MEBiC00475]
MSEIDGCLLIHSKNKLIQKAICDEFSLNAVIEVEDDEYSICTVMDKELLDIHIYTSEYSDTENICKYILNKYKPDILISTFDNTGFVQQKKVTKKKAFSIIEKISPQVSFYLNISYGNYKSALKILESSNLDLKDKFAGVPNVERCFWGDYSPLMEYAIDKGFHNYSCQYTHNLCFHEEGEHAIHRIVTTSDLKLLEKVLRLGASPDSRDLDQNTLLHSLSWYMSDECDFESLEIINILTEYGADFEAINWDGHTPLLAFAFSIADSQEEDEWEDCDRDKASEIVKILIENGASLNVYGKSGGGVLTYLSNYPDITKFITEIKPDLPRFTDFFDVKSYVLERSYMHCSDLPEEYEQFFCDCIKFGFTDYVIELHQIEILQSLNASEICGILHKTFNSPDSIKILTSFSNNKLPIFIDQIIEPGAEKYQSIDVFNYESIQLLLDFYNTVELKEHFKVIQEYLNGAYGANYRLVGP